MGHAHIMQGFGILIFSSLSLPLGSSDSLVEPRRSKGEDQSGMEEENITSEKDLSIHSENPMDSKEETNG